MDPQPSPDPRARLRARLRPLNADPEALERAYRAARAAGEEAGFAAAMDDLYREDEESLLYAAWHYRLLHEAARAARRVIAWRWALPLALASGLALFLLSDDERFELLIRNPLTGDSFGTPVPLFVLLAGPVVALALLAFLAGAGDRRWRLAGGLGLVVAAAAAYVVWVYPQAGTRPYQRQYLELMTMGLALLAWAAVGAYALRGAWDARNRFAFLSTSLSYAVVAGLFAIFLGLFTALTFGLFAAIDMDPVDEIQRLFFAGGAGAVLVLAAALVVAPGLPPAEQPFDEGPSRLVAMLLRVLLAPAILVLLVFLAFIPANFSAPLESREVLIAFNAMLFAVIGLLMGATPREAGELGPGARLWLRRGLLTLAALALAVGIYALVAIASRTLGDRLTPNRLTFIGWNVINSALLAWLLYTQWRAEREDWLPAFHSALGDGMIPYAAWVAFTLLALPWLFRVDADEIADLPTRVQELVYEVPAPILLKCAARPEVYLLDGGEKRWIEDIPTFEAEGYVWRDVSFLPCGVLDQLPDGPPIPPDAGSPPVE